MELPFRGGNTSLLVKFTIKRNKKAQGAAGIASGLCFEYGIDRLTLNNSGISSESTDKLYRSFFVTTVGFLNTIKELLKEQADQNKLTNGVHYQLKDVSPQDAIKHEKDQGGVQDHAHRRVDPDDPLHPLARPQGGSA